MDCRPIAHIHNDYTAKFGIPRQSGLVEEVESLIVFEPDYRNADALRGMEGFDYLWLIWGFSANRHAAGSLMVRPPLLGGNVRMGVFATRSPFRPNALGLSSVRIGGIETDTPRGPVIKVLGADLMDGTPIYDIKPYIAYTDSHPESRGGFTDNVPLRRLSVRLPATLAARLSASEREQLIATLGMDPRPQYHADDSKVYGMAFARFDVRFTVAGGVCEIRDIITNHK